MDYEKIIAALPAPVIKHLQENDILVAGGFIRDTLIDASPSDLDIFCKTEEVAKVLAESYYDGLCVTRTDCSYTVIFNDLKIQYVYCRPFTTAMTLLDEFDFTCCGVSIRWDQDFAKFTFDSVEGFETDLNNRELVFRCADYNKGNLGALTRAFKFVSKGWYISRDEISKIIHHYVAYNEAIRNVTTPMTCSRPHMPTTTIEFGGHMPTTTTVEFGRTEDGTFTCPDDTPLVPLTSVRNAVNPMYNARARRRN